MTKRTKFALGLLLAVSLLALPVLAVVDLDSPAYVVDDANVLSSDLEQRIIEANESFYNDCQGAEFVVITVKYSPSGLDHEEYAKQIFDTWGPGDAKQNNGMVLVLYTEEDDFWLETGYGIYNSMYVDEIADMVSDNSSFYRNILADKDEQAVNGLLEDITDWYESYYYEGSSFSYSDGYGSSYYEPASTSSSSGNSLAVLVIMVLFFIIVTSPFRIRRRYNRWGIWPLVLFSSWWSNRRSYRPSSYIPHSNGYNSVYHGSNHSFTSHSSSSGSSFHFGGSSHSSFGGGHSSGGFGGGHSSGGFHGGGGHSGGGFGHR